MSSEMLGHGDGLLVGQGGLLVSLTVGFMDGGGLFFTF